MEISKLELNSKHPTRRCISSGEICYKSDMIRFVVGPNNEILPDISEKLPGRGMWIKTNKITLKKAISKNLFLKAAKTKVLVKKDMIELIENILSKNLISLISLSRKSGIAVFGYEKVKSCLNDGTAKVLIQAKDGSADQKRKLRPVNKSYAFIDCISKKELGEAFGRNYVVHAALTSGGLSKRVVHEASRLRNLRGFETLCEEFSEINNGN